MPKKLEVQPIRERVMWFEKDVQMDDKRMAKLL